MFNEAVFVIERKAEELQKVQINHLSKPSHFSEQRRAKTPR